MLYFKNPNGQVFAYDSQEERDKFGPDDLVAMTQTEIDAHLNPPPPPIDPAAEIARLEQETLLPRPVRDVLLALMVKEAEALGLTEPQLYAANPGYRKVRDLDNQITALREML